MTTIGQFRLQPVLSYKEKRQETLETELAGLRHACQREEQGLERMKASEAETIDAIRQWQQDNSRVDVSAAGQRLTYLSWLSKGVGHQALRVDEARETVEGKRQELVTAAQETKALEKLKERDALLAGVAERRADTRVSDEIAIIQYHRRRMEAAGAGG
jgi:flagellar export protein FliJ